MGYICYKCGFECKSKTGRILHMKKCNGVKYCLHCGLETSNPKFCNSSCSAKYNNPGKNLSIETRKKISIGNGGDGSLVNSLKCLNCKKPLPYSAKKYCNATCQSEKNYNDFIKKWLENPTKFNKSSIYMKRYLLELCGNKCSKCGWNKKHPVTGNVPVELHHKDGDHKNNNPDNLEILCPNCHSLTVTYRIGNRGNGRVEQREYYHKNKIVNSASIA